MDTEEASLPVSKTLPTVAESEACLFLIIIENMLRLVCTLAQSQCQSGSYCTEHFHKGSRNLINLGEHI